MKTFDTKTKIRPETEGTYISNLNDYYKQYRKSIESPNEFWSEKAREFLDWDKNFTTFRSGSLKEGNFKYFEDGYLSVYQNCVLRHKEANPNGIALIYEADDPEEARTVTWLELSKQVKLYARVLKHLGVQKGDVVTIYMSTSPEAVYVILACSYIGAIHSVIFGGYSSEAVRGRLIDSKSEIVITQNESRRRGKVVPMKNLIDKAVEEMEFIRHVFVFERIAVNKCTTCTRKEKRDIYNLELIKELQKGGKYENENANLQPLTMNAEDPLFLLYTSGSTGKPKALIHTTGGYLLNAALTQKTVFDIRKGDKFGCMADIGWITGHTYIVYAPLINGVSTLLFESTPDFPRITRYWEVIDKWGLTQFYTSPTAIRYVMRFGIEPLKKFSLNSLRVIGSVGEPIGVEAWNWYFKYIGKLKCYLVDTYWMTESGAIMISAIPGATTLKRGSATLPLFGMNPKLLLGLNEEDNSEGFTIKNKETVEIMENSKSGVLSIKGSWPSLARTVFGDHQRFRDTYLKPYPGYFLTGDSAFRDMDGFYFLKGRIDDVLNVCAHRFGTSELESAITLHPNTVEVAVVGMPHKIKGEAIFVFCVLKNPDVDHIQIRKEIISLLINSISKVASPEHVLIVDSLPKTRSGKIMRRILKKIVRKNFDISSYGDLSTLLNPDTIPKIVDKVKKLLKI
ncbi:acetyl-coenzyme a synthetase 1 [Anaeramoeba flamelloides]|uniref:Acetyl-coenzyme A synthetase n=1 Tax=Anaeramoeba flamelloides TaxID=1746091 RepID=A0ABQ8XSL7_9EUKA|nr:acetyl-coenzyme a synthetase 1 [Anaeramoeba flamelloides]